MLVMRLQRVGRRNFATFRVIVTEHTRAPQSGKYVEMVGWWNPHTDKAEFKKERVEHWLSVGVQPSDTVYNLLIDAGILEGKKRNVLPRKSPPPKDEAEGGEAGAAGSAEEAAGEESSPEGEGEESKEADTSDVSAAAEEKEA